MQSTNSITLSIFKDTLSLSKKHWSGWFIFWPILFFLLSLALQDRSSDPVFQYLGVVILQGGFPLFFFSVYLMHKANISDTLNGVPAKARQWLNLFKWMKNGKLLIQAFQLAIFHIAFYFSLSFLTTSLNEHFFTDGTPSISTLAILFLLQAAIGTSFLALTWRMPALMAEGSSFLSALKESCKAFFKSWLVFTLFNLYLHIPTVFIGFGVFLSARGLQHFAAAGRIPPPEKLVEALTHAAPIGIYMVILGGFLQLFFWLVFLGQSYSPLFWDKVDLYISQRAKTRYNA